METIHRKDPEEAEMHWSEWTDDDLLRHRRLVEGTRVTWSHCEALLSVLWPVSPAGRAGTWMEGWRPAPSQLRERKRLIAEFMGEILAEAKTCRQELGVRGPFQVEHVTAIAPLLRELVQLDSFEHLTNRGRRDNDELLARAGYASFWLQVSALEKFAQTWPEKGWAPGREWRRNLEWKLHDLRGALLSQEFDEAMPPQSRDNPFRLLRPPAPAVEPEAEPAPLDPSDPLFEAMRRALDPIETDGPTSGSRGATSRRSGRIVGRSRLTPMTRSPGIMLRRLGAARDISSSYSADLLDRANENHEATLGVLWRQLRAAGLKPLYSLDPTQLRVDMACEIRPGVMAVFEAKSLTPSNHVAQVDKAVAQFPRYLDAYADDPLAVGKTWETWFVGSSELERTQVAYLRRTGKKVIWLSDGRFIGPDADELPLAGTTRRPRADAPDTEARALRM